MSIWRPETKNVRALERRHLCRQGCQRAYSLPFPMSLDRIRDLVGQPGRLSYLLAAAAVLAGLWGASRIPSPAFADSGGQVTYYTLTLCSPNDGAILADPIGPSYVDGTVVTLTADSDPGYAFDYWTGALSGSDNPETITMNAAKSVCAVFVADSTPPVITLIGDNPLYLQCGASWNDPGATADDNHNGEITDWILVGGDTVDPETPGTYYVTYDVQDEAENDATQVTRTVIVEDTTAPVITLLGDSPVDTPLGGTYQDAGATAADGCEGDLTANIVIGGDTVDDNTLGQYVITYNVSDAAANSAQQVTRTVNVVDLTPPVITLLGDNPQSVVFESTYSDSGATASDNVDGDLTGSIVVTGDTVDTSTAGNYTRYYDVEDAAGNEAETVSRVVTVMGPPQTLLVEGPVGGDILLTPPDPVHVVEDGTGNYSDDYDFGTEVFLAAVPATGYVFWEWSGDLYGTSQAVLLADDFDDQTLDPAWTVNAGSWSESGEEYLSVAAETGVLPQLTRSQPEADLHIEFEYRRVSGTAAFDVLIRWEDPDNHLYLSIEPGQLALKERAGGSTSTLDSAAGAASGAGEWYHVEIESAGAGIRVWRKPIEGPKSLLLSATAATLDSGVFGFVTGADTAYDVDKLLLRELRSRASVVMNEPHTVAATFLPEETVPPTITLLGDTEITLDCGDIFTDPGAAAYDARYGDLTHDIVVGGDTVEPETPGTYTITYDVMDRDGNTATQVTRDVVVGDTTPPAITLTGDNPLYLARNATYSDPGATATDNCDTALPAITVDATDVNSANFGSYTVTYNVSDVEENAATEVVRTVIVAPTLTIAKTNAGNTTPALGSHYFPLNAVVSLSATPPANFSHWEGDDIHLETDNPIDITMSADKSVTAVFHAGIYFPDANLEQAVRDAISKPTGSILPGDLENLTTLDAGDYGITDISGIQQIADLISLVLSENTISDLGPLAYLTGLTDLSLRGVSPSSLAPLASLTALAYLDLSCNSLEDLSDLEGLTVLSELDLSDNDISDLQALIDTRILEGGTLDLTDNPLGSLAWHVQLPLLEQYAGEVTYNDVLGHESDGLRTLVVGVKQGTGEIAINTVPAGGVETHELRNYEGETYDLLLAEYPAETGTVDAPSNPVSITATPEDVDGHLDYWMGAYFAFGPRDNAELTVILFEDTKLNAVMKVSPGLGTLDLVADFEDFVAEVLPAEDWETLDENGISYDSEVNPVFTGNGMPDVAELGLLNAVLKDTALDFSARSGVVSYFTWQAWEQNLAAAEAQLDGEIPGLSGKPYLVRVVAAYFTLGDSASTAWIDVVMDAYAGTDVLDFDAYDRSKQRYLRFDADADNEGARNIEEWQGLSLTGIIEEDIAAYAEVALDPEVRPDSAKAAGGVAKQVVAVDCLNANCIPTVQIGVWDPQTPPLFGPPDPLGHENTVTVIRGDTGATIPPGSFDAVPIGTRILVLATPDAGKRFGFHSWSVIDTLIHGSRELSESFYANGDTFIFAGFARNTVVVPKNSMYVTYAVGGALNAGPHPTHAGLVRYVLRPDQVATLSGSSTQFSRSMWVIQPGYGHAAPSHSRTNPVSVRGAGYAHISSVSAGERQAAIGLLSSRGGDLLGSSNEHNVGRVLDSVTDAKGSLVRVDASPRAGYKFARFSSQGVGFAGWNGNHVYGPTTSFLVAGKHYFAAALFEEKEEYSLAIEVDGDDPGCSGYVIATPAQKYYLPGTWVTLEAVALPGYKFVEWAGDASTWHHGVSPYSPEISFPMVNDYEVTAVFAKQFPEAPDEAFNPDTCQYCIHGGYPNAKLPGTNTPGPEGYLIGDIRFGDLPPGLGRYGPRDNGGDDWGCAYYIHQKLRDAAAAWTGETILFNDISLEGGGPFHPSSHQNGLDVDIQYQSTAALSNDLIELFTDDPQCEFVFVTHDTAINAGGIVKRIDGHTTHFHVRFSDPDGLPPIN